MSSENKARMFMQASRRAAKIAMPAPVSEDERTNERGEIFSSGPWWSGEAALPGNVKASLRIAHAYRRAAYACSGINLAEL